jgi:hypothetical protein
LLALVFLIPWAIGLLHRHSGPADSTMTAPPSSTTVPSISPASPLQIKSFEVQHFRGIPAQRQGTIGVLSHATRSQDHVKVKCLLSEPAYCYLIALNPDGSVQLCPKSQTDKQPELISEIVYPAEADRYYGLTDGTGLQAFVLVASRKPLPAFSAWPAASDLPWKPASAEGVWRFDGRELAMLSDLRRGTERRVPTASPTPLAEVCDYLGRCTGLDAVQAMAFPVLPPLSVSSPHSSSREAVHPPPPL